MAEDRPPLPADPASTARTGSDDRVRDQVELLRTLGDNLPDGFIYQVVATPDGGRRFTHLSAGVERVFGVPRAEALADAAALYGLIHPDDAPGVAAAEADALAGTKPFDREFRARTRAGEERWVHCRSAPQRLADGTVAWDGLLFDVTVRKRLEEAAALQTRLLDLSTDAIFVWELDGSITYWNTGAADLYGFTSAEAVGRVSHDLLATAFPAGLEAVRGALRRAGRWDGELIHTAKDGRRLVVDTRMVLGAGGHVLETNRDVTTRNQAEDLLREGARRKDRFIAQLAHELRNPLAPIGNAMHLLARSRDQAVVDKVQEIVSRQVAHLSRIVNDLIEVSRVARGQVELRRERLDLGRKARQAAEDLAGGFDKAGVHLAVDVPETPVWVEGDRTRLTQAVTNLLANAVKFTDRGGRVSVRVRPEGGQAVLTVADTGVGMTPETVARLFEPFAQADQSLARTRGGLGLGLALVKGFVELHGGTVVAASAGPGRGSEFTVRLPRAAEPPALTAAPPPTARPAGAPRKRVLIVEDNRDSADSLKLVFELTGYDVAVAYTGPDGAEAAKRVRPDLVICDIGLPGMDGYAVARRIRADLGPTQPVLVALTGYGEAADREKALAAGFDRHFTKPADPAALEAVLASRP